MCHAHTQKKKDRFYNNWGTFFYCNHCTQPKKQHYLFVLPLKLTVHPRCNHTSHKNTHLPVISIQYSVTPRADIFPQEGQLSLFEMIEEAKHKETTTQEAPPREHQQTLPAKKTEKKKKREQLKFLKPCPLCGGRQFTYTTGGGFLCEHCQPGCCGTPVLAGEPDRPEKPPPPRQMKLYGCSLDPKPEEEKRSGEEYTHLQHGLPWIRAHLSQLMESGWSRAALFRRGRHRYPLGAWGLVFCHCWSWPDVTVTLQENGAVAFRYKSAHDYIQQRATPPASSGPKRGQ